jgi:hypothetical protein
MCPTTAQPLHEVHITCHGDLIGLNGSGWKHWVVEGHGAIKLSPELDVKYYRCLQERKKHHAAPHHSSSVSKSVFAFHPYWPVFIHGGIFHQHRFSLPFLSPFTNTPHTSSMLLLKIGCDLSRSFHFN